MVVHRIAGAIYMNTNLLTFYYTVNIIVLFVNNSNPELLLEALYNCLYNFGQPSMLKP